MKGLVIFHDHEIAFCHADKDLESYLRERWTFLQKSAGATVRLELAIATANRPSRAPSNCTRRIRTWKSWRIKTLSSSCKSSFSRSAQLL